MTAALLRPTPIYLAEDLPRDERGRLIIDLYARMSDGFDGKQLNVDGQFDAAESYVLNRGAVVGERISDPLSAWKRGVARPGWDRIVHRMRTRQSAGASFWVVDRFLRQNRQLEDLLDTVDQMGCVIYDSSGERKLDNEDDRFILRLMVAQANKSSADTSRRVKNKFELQRTEGVLIDAGRRAFAWPGLEPKKPGHKRRREVSMEQVEKEREALKWAFKLIAEGGTLADVAREWNRRGLLTPFYANEWNVITVRNTMKRQRYAGRIEYHGEVVGNIADHKPTIDPELFDRVHGIFTGRAYGRPVGKTSLGSGIICCSKCLKPMVSRPRYRYRGGEKVTIPTYICVKGRGGCGGTVIDQAPVDEMLRKTVISRLSNPAMADQVSSIKAGQNAQIDRVRAELEEVRVAERGLAARMEAKQMTWQVFFRMQKLVFPDIARLEAELAALEAAAADLGAVRTQSELAVATEWDKHLAAGEIAALRIMIKSALGHAGLHRVEILPGKPRGKGAHIPPTLRFEVVALPSGIGNTTRRVGFVATASG